MVFLWGYDVPIVEIFMSISVLGIVLIILLLISLRRAKETNKKLDRLMGEEKQFKQELDVAKQEEDQQLALIRTIVKEMNVLNQIKAEEHEGVAAVRRLAKRAAVKFKAPDKQHGTDLKAVLDELAGHVDRLDHVSDKENKQLRYINQIVGRLRK
jgi:biopolymer transport protein ExbB/TolQ